jgi:putative DNA primase/helicase
MRFPHPPAKPTLAPPATVANVEHLLRRYGVTVRYNVVKKKLVITMPGYSGSPDNFDNVAMTHVLSLASLNGLPVGQIPALVEAIGDRNAFNPFADWIKSRPWDRRDRLPDIYASLTVEEDFPIELKEALMRRWLLSIAAANLVPSGFHCRGVLTLQGKQGIGKTAWTSALVSDEALRKGVVRLDHHLDASNKDSILTAVTHSIVEIGELDSSFRRDVARLKGFLTADSDKVRRPYARADSEYPRRTVFCATVNDRNFLVDMTGNSRWWTLPVTKVDFAHGIDMQQLFAQLGVAVEAGEPWWLTPEEERWLDEQNRNHLAVSALRERLLEELDLELVGSAGLRAMTASGVLRALGVQNPTSPQSRECGAILRELLGDPKKINGIHKWRVPLRETTGLEDGF